MHAFASICRRPARRLLRSAATPWALALLLVGVGSPARAATGLPQGFVETEVVQVPSPENLAQLAFAPDGRIFLADKFGKVRVFLPGPPPTLESETQLAVDATDERGINGLAIDPDYGVNRGVWVHYTAAGTDRNRVSRFEYDGAGLVDESVILEGPVLSATSHNGGCLRFASDKTLFVSTGDDRQGSVTAQDPFDLRGKLLRIDRSGNPARDNPFVDGVSGAPEVWALGFRNPYRISVQPGTDNVFIADVGEGAWEEVSLGIAGADFGWSDVEGPSPPAVPGKIYPIHSVAHPIGQGSAIIGGDFAPAEFAPGYEGDYFYAEFVGQTLWRVVLDVTNTPQSVELFAADAGPATDIRFGPDGALYYVCRSCNPAALRRIAYEPGANRPPIAAASALPDSGPAPLTVQLDGSASDDPDGDPLTPSWDLGDGTGSGVIAPEHTYPAGVYHATLTVDDAAGGSDGAPPLRIVSGNARPAPAINTPANLSEYDAGDLILYSGTPHDAEDGLVPCSAVSWQVFLHHAEHTHPIVGPVQGSCVGAFVIPFDAAGGPDQHYEIRMTARDSGDPLGPEAELIGRRSVSILPHLVALDFDSQPLAGLALTLDGDVFVTPATLESLAQAPRTIGALDPQPGPDGRWYRFDSWSDGGGKEHGISPAADTGYTAQFACVPSEIANLHVEPGVGGAIDLTWDEPSGDCLAEGGERFRLYAAADSVPSSGSGTFPDDPSYRLVTLTGSPAYSYVPDPDDVYFLVVGVAPDGFEGRIGHYGR